MSAKRCAPGTRDQDTTAFGALLLRLRDSTGALGVALVDQIGETVDYAGSIGSFEIRVAAAEWRLVLRAVSESLVPGWAETTQITVRAGTKSFAIVALPEGYALVLELPRRCFGLSPRALAEASREISREAGLEDGTEKRPTEHWSRVEVRTLSGEPRRPEAIWFEDSWVSVEVLGRYQLRGETGYRARLANGAEINLVREKLGFWYAEDLPGR